MIFMSQSGITDPSRERDWDAWYFKHLEIMATVPGISSAQRFRTKTEGHSPSLAMYSVASPDVFQDHGTGWQSRTSSSGGRPEDLTSREPNAIPAIA